MDLTLDGDTVRADSRAREQFYDSRGYGHTRNGDLDLAPVEAAHLLNRGDIESVGGMNIRELLSGNTVSMVDFLVYTDLRDRGFYLTPARDGWVDAPEGADFVVYPRGKGPWEARLPTVSEQSGSATISRRRHSVTVSSQSSTKRVR
jgi:tRNA-intron endonuclease